MKLFLYRTLGIDEDGDPIDHGAVRAMGIEHAAELVIKRVKKLAQSDDVEKVRIYPLSDRNTPGILEDAAPFKDFEM